jgi:hypothetical protein
LTRPRSSRLRLGKTSETRSGRRDRRAGSWCVSPRGPAGTGGNGLRGVRAPRAASASWRG